jgi:hypothetical protein
MHLEIPGTLPITGKGLRVLLRNVVKPKLMCRSFTSNARHRNRKVSKHFMEKDNVDQQTSSPIKNLNTAKNTIPKHLSGINTT